jgi:hypothetical protein
LNFDGKFNLQRKEEAKRNLPSHVPARYLIRCSLKTFSGSNFAAPLSSERLRSIFRVPILKLAPALNRGEASMWVVAAAAAHTGGVIIPFV